MRAAATALLLVTSACVGALHVLRPDLGPVEHRLSEYANGPHGWLMAVAFVALGLGLACLAAATAPEDGRGGRLVPLLLAAGGVGMVVSAAFPTDGPGPVTTTGEVHSAVSGLATLAVVVAAVVRSLALSRSRRGGQAALAAAGPVLAVVSRALHDTAWRGVGQRALWLVLMAWLLTVAWPGPRPRARPP